MHACCFGSSAIASMLELLTEVGGGIVAWYGKNHKRESHRLKQFWADYVIALYTSEFTARKRVTQI